MLKKRCLSTILSTAFALSAFLFCPVAVVAAEGDFVVDFINGSNMLTGYKGTSPDVVIPKGVEFISGDAFRGNTSIKSVRFEDASAKVDFGDGAFSFCVSLNSIVLPEGTAYIGNDVFEATALTSINIPASVDQIGTGVFFRMTKLKSVNVAADNGRYKSVDGILFNKNGDTLLYYPGAKTGAYTVPSGVTEIGYLGFAYSALTSVTIPDTVERIGDYAFTDTEKLMAINVGEGNERYKSVDGVLFSKGGDALINYPAGKTAAGYVVPDGVTWVGAMSSKALKSVTLPDSVTALSSTFYKSGLERVKIGPNVTALTNAFAWCFSLTAIDVDANNKVYKSVDGVLLSKDGKRVICYPKGKPDKVYTVPDGVEIVDGMGTYETNDGGGRFERVIVPVGVKKLDNFFGCANLEDIEIPDTVTEIGSFGNCPKLTSVTIPKGVTKLGKWTFGYVSVIDGYIAGKAEKVDGFTIHGETGSAAEKHAKAQGFNFVPTNAPKPDPNAPKVGTKLGDVLFTDIKAYINGQAIPSYNISGSMYVLAADLRNYGFDVTYDDKTRATTIKLVAGKGFTPLSVEENTGKVGSPAFAYLYTDIRTYINGKEVTSRNVNNKTAIPFAELKAFGTVSYDDATRSSRLTVK